MLRLAHGRERGMVVESDKRSDMRLNYFLPSQRFRSLLTIHAAVDDVTESTIEILPAMLPNLHIRLAGHSTYIFADGQAIAAPPVSLIGPTSSAFRIVLSEGFRMMAVGFLPVGWQALVRLPAFECVDRLLDGECLWGARATARIVERLHAAPRDGSHLDRIEAFLADRVDGPSLHRLQQIVGIDQWLEHALPLSLDDLCSNLDVGARHLRRLTLDCYGMSPKTLTMKYRALRAAASMSQRDFGEAITASRSYADQSHMIRDFHRFVGWTPGAFTRERQNIAAATMIGRRQAGAERPLVLWS
jgi:AraC-like DNA-binding protein